MREDAERTSEARAKSMAALLCSAGAICGRLSLIGCMVRGSPDVMLV